MTAPLKGKEVRKVVSIRIEPTHKNLLIKHYGSIQKAIDFLIATLDKGRKK